MITEEKKLKQVIIFDDNINVRESIGLLLSTTDNMQLVAAFDSCKNMLADIENINPDIVLMDIDMPLITGIDAVKLLRTKYPALPVLMLSLMLKLLVLTKSLLLLVKKHVSRYGLIPMLMPKHIPIFLLV